MSYDFSNFTVKGFLTIAFRSARKAVELHVKVQNLKNYVIKQLIKFFKITQLLKNFSFFLKF